VDTNENAAVNIKPENRQIHKIIKKGTSKQQKKFFMVGLLFALPWIIGFLFFQLYPILCAIFYSFTDFNIFQKPNFIEFENYKNLFVDPKFYQSLGNTAYMAFLGLPIGLVVALLIALLLNMNVKGMSVFRTLCYMPTVVPMVASAMLFLWVLNPEYGLINIVLEPLGISGPSWLRDPRFTKLSLIIMDTWRCGNSAIIFLAALQAVPKSLYESAEIDGATSFRKLIHISIPSISPTILFLTIMGLIYSFQYFTQGFVFAQVMELTQTAYGGPENSLLFYSLYLYQNGLSFLKMGYASAMAIILFIVVMTVSVIVIKMTNKRISYDLE